MKSNSLIVKFLFLIILLPAMANANVILPSFFSDNMVLQRNAEVKIWGWGHPFEEIIITPGWTTEKYKAVPNNQAYWEIKIKTPGAGGPYQINFKGYNEILLNNVMLGEVWFCSGQSNMEWTANAGIDNAEEEIANANYPDIRFYNTPKLSAETPQINMPGNWKVCTPETMRHSTAIGYFFAQYLQKDLNGVAVGIINSSWGGTPAEIWMPAEAFSNNTVAQAAAKLTPMDWGPTEPARAYNAMVNPIVGYTIAGALWYQGESNTGSDVYDVTLAALINSWRAAWQSNFPFYFVQIAPFNYEGGTTQGVTIRNAQRKVLDAVTKTGMVVISDISPTDDIHPRDKRSVGKRLANLALSSHYGIDKGIVNSPLFKYAEYKGSKAIVYFNYADGLHFKGKSSAVFELAGADGVFFPAKATVKNNTVEVVSKKVKEPKYVRYAWHNTAQANLFNKAGLPASSFTSK
ncbi:sialate O-acetylesterase [Flavobacterium sp. MK4S-17]|uniref:sialate O-acetylesterase n=1 Tax=Flavobacterium sp. MK4S-17 TaxID=2543737 RepID=UPI00135CC8A1|nr:sialate O-acetylesterase [Flavobacterium sp. MK4S-17]